RDRGDLKKGREAHWNSSLAICAACDCEKGSLAVDSDSEGTREAARRGGGNRLLYPAANLGLQTSARDSPAGNGGQQEQDRGARCPDAEVVHHRCWVCGRRRTPSFATLQRRRHVQEEGSGTPTTWGSWSKGSHRYGDSPIARSTQRGNKSHRESSTP